MTKFHHLSLLLAISIHSAEAALAQASAGLGEVRGTVLNALDSSKVSSATIDLVGSGSRTTTDENGAFTLQGVRDGKHHLQVQKIGFKSTIVEVSVSSQQPSVVVVELAPVARALTQIEVEGRKLMVPSHLRSAYERVARNQGTRFTGEDISAANPLLTKDLLQRIPGVHVNDRGITFARCQGGLEVTLNRHTYPTSGKLQVYVNGVRQTGKSDEDDADRVLRSIHPLSIELMEVYRGVARIPAEFLADACAVIAVWTKTY